MQATTTPDSPTTNDPNKKKTNVKRAKASVACQECRKRKVKCEGIQPCERCRKSSLTCVFPQQQNAKRNQPKQYIEILETRLKNMERTLLFMGGTSIQNMIDGTLHLDPHSIQDRNGIHEDDTTIQQPNEFHASSIHRLQDQYTMNEIGQPYYTQDIYRHIQQQQQQYYSSNRPMTLHRQPSDMSLPTNNDTGIHSEPTTPTPSPHHHHHQQHQHLLSKSEYDLIEIYFEYIHPYLPMIHTVMFKRQLMDVNEQPPLFLIYAMCALASRWIPSSQQQQQLSSINEPPGFTYYRRAYALIDEAMVAPRVTTIQALILLAKYQEQYKRLGSFYRTDQYLTIATEMCFHLNLMDLPSHHHVDNQDFETKKRTFWVTFLYDLWLSIEKGRKPSFDIKLCKTDYPTADSNEGPDIDDIISRQNMVIRLGKIISEIYEFSRVLAERRQEQGSIRTEEQQIEEQGKLFTLQTYLESYLREITTISRFDYSPSNYIIHQMNHPLQVNNDNTNNSNSNSNNNNNNNNNNNTINNNNNNNTTTNNNNNNNGNSNNNNITINGQSTIKYPIDQVPVKDPFVGFLHMMYHYAIILLHLHHTLFPSNKPIITPPYPHQQLCASSASIINGITESILDSNPIDTFYYPIRGVQFTLLCSTMANTVHKFEMKTTQDEQRKKNAEGLYRQILTIIGRLSNETSAMELQFLAKEADLAEMYNKLAVDTNDVKNGGGLYNSNNMNDTPPPPPPPPSSTHSPNSTITMNNDNSSASSSPILSPSHASSSTSSVVVDKMHRSMKMVNKPKRNTMPTNGATSLKRFSSPTFSTDQLYTNYPLPSSSQQQQQQSLHHHLSNNNTSLQQQQPMPSSASSVLSGSSATTTTATSTATPMNPSVLFNSSASITDPSRLEYMMQSGKFPMASFNHHQQPIQIPIHHPSPPQQQSIHNTLKRMPRTQGIPYSQSTDDLRSLNSRHKNRAGYSRIASSSIATGMEDPPIRLKKQRSMKFPPTYSTTTHIPPSSSSSSSSSSTSSTSHIQQHYHSSNIPSQLSMPPTTHSISISSQQQQQQQPLTHFQTKPMLSLPQHQQQQPIIYHQPFNNNHNTYPLTSQPLSFSSSPSSSPSSSSMNYSMIPSSPTISGIPRRHTISSTGFETSQPPQPIGMIPSNGIPMDYTIQSPLVTMDTTQLEYHPPLSSLQQQQLSSSSFMTSSSLQQQHHHQHHHPNTTSFYTSSMNHNNSANNGGDHLMMESDMHHPFLNDSSLGSNLDMDRKMEGHVLQ